MPLANAQNRIDHDMKIDPVVSPTVTMTQLVKAADDRQFAADADMAFENAVNQPFVIDVLAIHQAPSGPLQKKHAEPGEVCGDEQRDERIGIDPASKLDDEQCDCRRDARDGIGLQMPAVRFQGDGPDSPSGANQIEPQNPIARDGDHQQDEADSNVFDVKVMIAKRVECSYEDHRRGDDNQQSLHCG